MSHWTVVLSGLGGGLVASGAVNAYFVRDQPRLRTAMLALVPLGLVFIGLALLLAW